MAKSILICDDAAFMRMMIKDILTKNGYNIAGEAENGVKAIEKYGEVKPDLVLMDICTENDSDGLTAAEEIKKCHPGIKIVMVTSMLEERFLDRAKKLGANSFWYKDSPSGDLASVIEGTLTGKSFWPDDTPAVRLGNALSCDLSSQELETLRLLCEGHTNAEIAAKLNVAETSVRTYINRM